jgi:ribonucleoside-triphosphate reductase
MDKSRRILSDIITYLHYSKFLPDVNRRESWEELVSRNMNMHISKFPELEEEIKKAYKNVFNKQVLPSMRSMQFAGKAIEKNNSRIFNCSYLPMDNYRAFSEIMFLLLGGTGVGYSVQKHHVSQLPEIKKARIEQKFVVDDSIIGWSDAINALVASYFGARLTKPRFDYSDIRNKGVRLVTAGGKAPGPDPLKKCVFMIQSILDKKENGQKLRPIEVHDINCHIADAVLAGGIRRAAMIALFSFSDTEMAMSKYGKYWELNPQRSTANNSAVSLRHRLRKEDFYKYFDVMKESGTGDPGIFATHDKDYGINPCGEASLRAFQFCNLTTINGSEIKNQQDLEERVWSASLIGTLQASYTDLHYLRPQWIETTQKDSLLGISMTGICSGDVFSLDLKKAVKIILDTNEKYSKLIGINTAARTTMVKPEGTSSLILGTSSGIHPWWNDYYIRRKQINKVEPIYEYLKINFPQILEDDLIRKDVAHITIPIKAPEGAITRHEPVLDMLKRIEYFNDNWIVPGHRSGDNTHSVSATIYAGPEDWDTIREWMWSRRDKYNGVTVFPKDSGFHRQAPHEDITKEKYEEMYAKLQEFDVRKIPEENDNTNFTGELACAGDSCLI